MALKFEVITIFPEMVSSVFKTGVVSRGISKKFIELNTISPRAFAEDRHQTVDDRPFGGGDGLVMKPTVLKKTLDSLKITPPKKQKIVYLTPQGQNFNQKKAKEWSNLDSLVLICGRYAGVDERFVSLYVDEEVSVGDFVLTGGEIPAMTIIDSVSRLIPGVLGNETSSLEDSFEDDQLEYPQYTQPRSFEGLEVPEILLSGHHMKIKKWRKSLALLRTFFRRGDLFEQINLDPEEWEKSLQLYKSFSKKERKACGLPEDAQFL